MRGWRGWRCSRCRASGACRWTRGAWPTGGVVRRSTTCRCPSVAVGNLTVGGSGKTPIAIWIARHYVARGLRPGILLRGYGDDEALVHQHAVPEAVVVADPDRAAGAERALANGAQVLVLDDAYQRLDVRRDLNILVISAETTRAVRWPLPAGPVARGWAALDRADAVIVTRKRATAEAARDAGGRAARPGARGRSPWPTSGWARLEGLVSGTRRSADRWPASGWWPRRHRRSRRLRGPDQGDRRGGAGGHLEGPSRLPRRGRRLAGPRGPPGRPRGDHPEGRRQAAGPLARRGPRAAGGRCST